ncbi:acetyltransferase [Arthrobacter nitrophenolicus]|uniref:Acetyltransferase n=1 Tax=Arthrobacter nitrophenolicus TaxID=683150 RepID=L8TMS6_9MICC|nr:acetyltransferase [Arthrobacter nitrophenolicus]
MNGWSRDEVRDVYAFLDSLDTHHGFLMTVDGEPAGVFQTYEPLHDPVAEVYPARAGDAGIHLLLAPAERPIPNFTATLLSGWCGSCSPIRRRTAWWRNRMPGTPRPSAGSPASASRPGPRSSCPRRKRSWCSWTGKRSNPGLRSRDWPLLLAGVLGFQVLCHGFAGLVPACVERVPVQRREHAVEHFFHCVICGVPDSFLRRRGVVVHASNSLWLRERMAGNLRGF